jgi:hypothetical protein
MLSEVSERLAMLAKVLYHHITLAIMCDKQKHIVSLAYSLFASFRYASFVLIRLVALRHICGHPKTKLNIHTI